jgi:hypothetical protein
LQILANIATNLLVLDLCMAIAFTTVLIAATLDAKDDLSINEDQASWLGNIQAVIATRLYWYTKYAHYFNKSPEEYRATNNTSKNILVTGRGGL